MVRRHRYPSIGLICLNIFLVLFVSISFSFFSYGEDLQERLKSIEEEIKKYEERLKKEKEKEFSILDELERINSELKEVKEKIKNQKSKLYSTEQRLAKIQNEIKDLGAKLQKRKEWLNKRLRVMWTFGYTRELEFLLTSRDIGEFLRNWRYLVLLTRYDRTVMNRFKEEIEERKKKEAELVEIKKEIKRTLALIESEELKLLKIKKEKSLLLAFVKEKKENYEKMLKELNESAKRLAKIIEESKIKGSSADNKKFLSMKGRLLWPVNGKVKIPFGYQKDPLTGVPVFRSGIYITTEEGVPVLAVFNGRVAYTGELKGYGKVIIISHGGDYHTVYANLSEIFFKPGDIIIERQAIGRTGESQIMEGQGLYFEIRYKGKPLDPLQWLMKR
jgi:septal ring factor EnvC (AmiA/AmiB activator)